MPLVLAFVLLDITMFLILNGGNCLYIVCPRYVHAIALVPIEVVLGRFHKNSSNLGLVSGLSRVPRSY